MDNDQFLYKFPIQTDDFWNIWIALSHLEYKVIEQGGMFLGF
jgi:hypothetical protein